MNDLYARTVFHVADGERSLSFYRDELGFSLDWNYAPNGRSFVFQMSLLGFQLILNEVEDRTKDRAGRGRVFVGVEDDQLPQFRRHFEDHDIRAEVVSWGEPTLLVRDPDGNWITFWLPGAARGQLKIGRTWP